MPKDQRICPKCGWGLSNGSKNSYCPRCKNTWKELNKEMKANEKVYTEAELKQSVKEEREEILAILIEEQEEFAEDRDKQCLVYSIAAIKGRE